VNELIDHVQTKEKGTRIKIEVLRDKKPMTFEVEVAEDESGGPLGSDGLQSFLESWQGYTDALQNEIRNWSGDESLLKGRLLRGLTTKGGQRRI
jgi:hypothetical protein